jgi:zinc transport system substrate-binding protein
MFCATPAVADVPSVVADIAPVHAIAARVMEGVGAPSLIIPQGASPHSYAMRPSEARAIAGADVIVWVGHGLTPWLEDPLDALAGDVTRIALMDAPGMELLPFRESEAFGAHDHDDGHGHEGHDHADKDHAHHDGPADESQEVDPHLWLDPQNGVAAARIIAAKLAEIDPENADTYLANATAFEAEIAQLSSQIAERVGSLGDRPFLVFHDAFHYFEHRFGIEARGSVSAGDAAKPGAARVAEVRAHARKVGAVCAFAEPQINAGLLDTITQGLETRVATLDPLGAGLTPGATLYADLLRGLAEDMAACLSPSG